MKRNFSKRFTIALTSTLLALSAAATAVSGFAWFTASNLVKVSGMNIQAEAEEGIVVANETHAANDDWSDNITASHDGTGNTFVPTSTATTATWYHGLAAKFDDGQEDESVQVITPVDNIAANDPAPAYGTADDGIYGFFDGLNWKSVYLLNSFYIRSSSASALTGQDIFVRDFQAKVGENAPAQDLSKGLRVAVVKHGQTNPVIVAPVDGADLTYDVGIATSKEVTDFTVTAGSATTNSSSLVVDSNVTIPATNANALQYDVFIYFEGEDENVKSSNLEASLEELSVQFKFGNKSHQ